MRLLSSAGMQKGDPFAAIRESLGLTPEREAELLQQERDELAACEEFMPHREFECERYLGAEPSECEGVLRIRDKEGVIWPCECDVCGFEVGVQVQRLDPARLVAHRKQRAGLPEEFAGRHFDPSIEENDATLRTCRQWIRDFRKGPLPAITLWGDPGRGKSHLLALVCEALVDNYAVDVLYRRATVLFDELQAAFDGASGEYKARWQRMLTAPVLALDDLGAGRMTDWRQERFAELVDWRYSKELPLLVATNLRPPAWDRVFGPRTSSRLKGMTVLLEMRGPDWRAQGVQQTLETAA